MSAQAPATVTGKTYPGRVHTSLLPIIAVTALWQSDESLSPWWDYRLHRANIMSVLHAIVATGQPMSRADAQVFITYQMNEEKNAKDIHIGIALQQTSGGMSNSNFIIELSFSLGIIHSNIHSHLCNLKSPVKKLSRIQCKPNFQLPRFSGTSFLSVRSVNSIQCGHNQEPHLQTLYLFALRWVISPGPLGRET